MANRTHFGKLTDIIEPPDLIEIQANGAPIVNYDFAAGVVAPKVVAIASLDAGTKITVYERCNLHGYWVAETTV